MTPEMFSQSLQRNYVSKSMTATNDLEQTRWKGLETIAATERVVSTLEAKLGISRRWTMYDEEWIAADKPIAEQDYQPALDSLEGLVVSRLFELSKMNKWDTCELLLDSWCSGSLLRRL